MTTPTPTPNALERIVLPDGRLNGVWHRFFKQFIANQKDMAAVEDGITQIEGQWGIAVNDNGRVTGLILLSSEESESTFAVLADKFIVVHPSADGTVIQAFVVGLVNGVSTVGINGNLVVDDTILARHIAVDTLSALAANIGECTAGVVRSSDSKFVIDLNNKTLTITT